MARTQEFSEHSSTETLIDKPNPQLLEQRGRQHKVALRHEFGNKNIQFKGTLGYNANEILRSRSQLSRNSSNHSIRSRNHSSGNLLLTGLGGGQNLAYPTSKTLLSAYNDKTVSDTVLPTRHSKQQQPMRPPLGSSRTSSNSSLFKKNYTFRSESLTNVRDRQDSLIGFQENQDIIDRFKSGLPNKAASISGPVTSSRRAIHKKSSLNHSAGLSVSTSECSEGDEDSTHKSDDDPEVEIHGNKMSYESMHPSSSDNLFPKPQFGSISASPKTKIVLEEVISTAAEGKDDEKEHKHPNNYDRTMRTLERQINIRDQAISTTKEEEETNELTLKWNSFVTLDDRRMFELITHDLRRMARYSQRPMVEGLNRCEKRGYLKSSTNAPAPLVEKFDLSKSADVVRQFWKELDN